MDSRIFRADFGPYSLLIPTYANLTAEVTRSPPSAYQIAFTSWLISLGRFKLTIVLDARLEMVDLSRLIEEQTKQIVMPEEINVNGIDGVRYGDYSPASYGMEWWFKRGDTMICLTLQSVRHLTSGPTEAETTEHQAVIASLKFTPDHVDDAAPLPLPL